MHKLKLVSLRVLKKAMARAPQAVAGQGESTQRRTVTGHRRETSAAQEGAVRQED